MPSSTSQCDAHLPQPLQAADLLTAWEQGHDQVKVARALTVLCHGLRAADRDAIADLPVGQRNSLLLQLWELSFGPVGMCRAMPGV